MPDKRKFNKIGSKNAHDVRNIGELSFNPESSNPGSEIRRIFKIVAAELPAAGALCVLIGGFAVNYYGYSRNTLDVDFMIAASAVEIVRKIMVETGFSNVSLSDNVAFFSAPASAFRIDFLLVDLQTMQKLDERASDIEYFENAIKIAKLEDLLAMKLFALKHAWECRVHKDLPDVAHLVVINNLDKAGILKRLCMEFADAKIYAEVLKEINVLETK